MVSGVTMPTDVGQAPSAEGFAFHSEAAPLVVGEANRWGPYAARRIRFFSRRQSMTACCCRLIQPEKSKRKKASGGGSGSMAASLTQVRLGSKRGLAVR
jgi:hypothetical protein